MSFDFGYQPPTFPMILRTLSPFRLSFYIQDEGHIDEMDQVVWMMDSVRFSGQIKSRPLSNCINSTYIYQGHIADHTGNTICVKFKYLAFLLHTKPWSCETNLGNFPPKFCLQTQTHRSVFLDYPVTWHVEHEWLNWNSPRFPVTVTRFHAVVVNRNLHQHFITSNGYSSWVSKYVSLWGDRNFLREDVYSDMFFILETERKSQNLFVSTVIQHVELIRAICSLKVCLDCDAKDLEPGNYSDK